MKGGKDLRGAKINITQTLITEPFTDHSSKNDSKMFGCLCSTATQKPQINKRNATSRPDVSTINLMAIERTKAMERTISLVLFTICNP